MDMEKGIPLDERGRIELRQRAAARVERGWCQNAMARVKDGCEVSAFDEDAVEWCMMAAILKEGEHHVGRHVWKLIDDITMELPNCLPTRYMNSFNDAPERTVEQVAAALRGNA